MTEANEQMIDFEHVRTVPLSYNGECGLLGVGPDLSFYAEEIYGEEGWMTQTAYDFEGQRLAGEDEASGDNQGVERLAKPVDLVRPRTGLSSARLNFGGARHRGLVDEDRVEEVVRPLELTDKVLLIEAGLVPPVDPPAIFGLAQSYVASEAQLVAPGRDQKPVFLLSRRLRVAYRLPEPAVNSAGEWYDYDSHEVAVLQHHSPGDEDAPLGDTLLGSAALGVELNWPTDIVFRDGTLFAADSAQGREDVSSRVHIWRVAV
jgi:hypothetical protein